MDLNEEGKGTPAEQAPTRKRTRVFELSLAGQADKIRALLALFMLAVVLVAPEPLISNRPAVYGAVALATLITLWVFWLRDVRVLWARGHLHLAVGILLLADIAWLSLFVYGTGSFHSPFASLLLLVILFAAVLFEDLPTALPSVAWIVAMVHIAFAATTRPTPSTWQATGRLLAIFAIAWLAYGLSRVLERERSANESVIRNLTEGVLLIDGNQTIVLVNPQIEKLCDLPSELIVGRAIRRIPRQSAYEPLLKLVAGAGEVPPGGGPLRRDVSLELPEPMDLRITTIPLGISGSRLLGWVVVCQDITDVKAAARMREEGIAILSHELRSPLSTLRAVAQVLSTLTDSLNPEQQASYVAALDKETDRLVNLVSMLLDVSTLEEGTCTLHMEPVQVEELIAKLVSVFQLKASQRGITLNTECESQLPELTADAPRLEQVITNLCENALKYTPEGGTVKLSSAANNGQVEIAVSDTGCGIAPDKLEAIFEKFGQADEAAGVPLFDRGMGLGLYIARTIVVLHGGAIRVDSTVGQGSTFYVTLPVNPPQPAATVHSPS